MTTPTIAAAVCAWALVASISNLRAATVIETFGSGSNAFSIAFVDVGNAGNADIPGSPYGEVTYNYRMAVTEVPQDWITKATASGLLNVTAGAHTGLEPAADMTWYESAAFINYLNTSTGHQRAYNLAFSGDSWSMTLWSSTEAWQAGGENLYRHKDAYYFLPSEDEWCKAAYHKNDGATGNYWTYATGSDSAPTQELTGATTPGSAIYDGVEPGVPADPADVHMAGGLSPYLTMGQSGNVWDWQESAFNGSNDSSSESRVRRGGTWDNSADFLRSGDRFLFNPANSADFIGFRVASVPEPSSTVLMIGAGWMLLLRRRLLP